MQVDLPQIPSLLSQLPEETLLHIFSHLDIDDLARVEQVCCQTRRLALDVSLWKSIFERYNYHRIRDDFVMHTELKRVFISFQTQKSETIFHAYLSSKKTVTDLTIDEALTLCPNYFLRQIYLEVQEPRSCQITGIALRAIITKYPRLLSLCLISTVTNQFAALSETDLLATLSSAKKLQSIAITGCPQITEAGYQSIFKQAAALQEVWLESDVLSDQVIISLLNNHPHLQTLKITCHSKKISDNLIKVIGGKGLSLRRLEITSNEQSFSSKQVKKIFPNLRFLTTLSLEAMKKVSKSFVKMLTTNIGGLQSLCLNNCSGITKKSIITLGNCQKLASLCLSGCKKPEKLSQKVDELKKQNRFPALIHHKISS